MGLDNGLLLHSKEPVDVPVELSIVDFANYEATSPFPYTYDILYFRKCWNIRREVCAILGASYEYCGKSWLTIGEVKNMWRALNELNSKKAWESGDSIWSYAEIKSRLDASLLALEWLIDFMRKHENEQDSFMVEFYDSY